MPHATVRTRTMNNPKGIAYAALSSSTFGLAPLFTVTLLRDGFHRSRC